MKKQMQLTLATDVMEALQTAAEKKGISPNVLARMILHEQFGQSDAESKIYTFKTRNWRELEAFVKVRNLGTVEGFAPVAMDMAMSRNKLSPRQKAQIEELLGKQETPPSAGVRTGF